MSRNTRLEFQVREFITDVRLAAASRKLRMSDVAAQANVCEATLSKMKRHSSVPTVCAVLSLAMWAKLDPADYLKHRAK